MRSVVTPQDLAKGKPVPAGWYPLEITNVEIKPSKGTVEKPSDGSENAVYEFTATDGPDEVKGRKITRYYNEKALGFGDALWSVLFPDSYKRGVGGELNTQMFLSTKGRKLMGYVKMDGKWPTIEDFKPIA